MSRTWTAGFNHKRWHIEHCSLWIDQAPVHCARWLCTSGVGVLSTNSVEVDLPLKINCCDRSVGTITRISTHRVCKTVSSIRHGTLQACIVLSLLTLSADHRSFHSAVQRITWKLNLRALLQPARRELGWIINCRCVEHVRAIVSFMKRRADWPVREKTAGSNE